MPMTEEEEIRLACIRAKEGAKKHAEANMRLKKLYDERPLISLEQGEAVGRLIPEDEVDEPELEELSEEEDDEPELEELSEEEDDEVKERFIGNKRVFILKGNIFAPVSMVLLAKDISRDNYRKRANSLGEINQCYCHLFSGGRQHNYARIASESVAGVGKGICKSGCYRKLCTPEKNRLTDATLEMLLSVQQYRRAELEMYELMLDKHEPYLYELIGKMVNGEAEMIDRGRCGEGGTMVGKVTGQLTRHPPSGTYFVF